MARNYGLKQDNDNYYTEEDIKSASWFNFTMGFFFGIATTIGTTLGTFWGLGWI